MAEFAFLQDCHRLMLFGRSRQRYLTARRRCYRQLGDSAASTWQSNLRGASSVSARQPFCERPLGVSDHRIAWRDSPGPHATLWLPWSHARRARSDRVGANRDSCFAGATSPAHPSKRPVAWFRQAAIKSTMLRIQVSKTMRITSRHYPSSKPGQAVRLRASG